MELLCQHGASVRAYAATEHGSATPLVAAMIASRNHEGGEQVLCTLLQV